MARFEPGDYVKAKFRDERGGKSERMWLGVESADDKARAVFGQLDNEPVAGLRLGTELAVSYDNCRDQTTASVFGQPSCPRGRLVVHSGHWRAGGDGAKGRH
jgi:hypothetical protein